MEDGTSLSLFSLDYSEDCQDEEEEGLAERDPYEGDEDAIRTRHKLDSVATISRLRVQPLVHQGSIFPCAECWPCLW